MRKLARLLRPPGFGGRAPREPVHLGWARSATPRSRVRFPAGSPLWSSHCPCTHLVRRPDCLSGEEGSIPFAGANESVSLALVC